MHALWQRVALERDYGHRVYTFVNSEWLFRKLDRIEAVQEFSLLQVLVGDRDVVQVIISSLLRNIKDLGHFFVFDDSSNVSHFYASGNGFLYRILADVKVVEHASLEHKFSIELVEVNVLT